MQKIFRWLLPASIILFSLCLYYFIKLYSGDEYYNNLAARRIVLILCIVNFLCILTCFFNKKFQFVLEWVLANKLSTLLVATTAILTAYLFFEIFKKIYGSDFDTNVFKWSNYEYHFCSSKFPGPYKAFGEILDTAGPFDGNLRIKQDLNSGGAYDNALTVNTTSNTFALVQENLIKKGDILGEKIEYVTPLYMERMHIFYRKASFPGFTPEISDNPDREFLKRLNKCTRINIGPTGSGTRLIAGYVLNEIHKQIRSLPEAIRPKEAYRTSELPLYAVLDEMGNPKRKDTIDIAFHMTAAPIWVIEKLLSSKEYGLMSISPSFVIQLNRAYNLNLRLTSFSKKFYGDSNAVSTLGTLAFLATNSSTPKPHILSVLREINKLKDSINCSIYGKHRDSTAGFGLYEYNFYEHFKKKYDDTFQATLKGMLGFLVTFFSVFAIVLKQLYWLISLFNKWRYNIRLKQYSLEKKRMNESANKTILEDIHTDIVADYANGRLVEAHFNGLKEEIELYKKDFPPDEKDNRQRPAA